MVWLRGLYLWGNRWPGEADQSRGLDSGPTSATTSLVALKKPSTFSEGASYFFKYKCGIRVEPIFLAKSL